MLGYTHSLAYLLFFGRITGLHVKSIPTASFFASVNIIENDGEESLDGKIQKVNLASAMEIRTISKIGDEQVKLAK